MRRSVVTGFLAFGIMVGGSAAQAGIYSDDLGKCLVRSTSPDDQIQFTQWIFSIMARHPAVEKYSKISPEAHAELSKKAGALYQRLMTVDCRTETVSAIKYEGQAAIESAFNTLGQVAMRGLMADPKVMEGLEGLAKSMDLQEIEKMMRESGLNPPK